MFIVWGKTIKRQKLGFVADYCPVCRDLRAFQMKRVGSASHVYYVSFGEGDLVGYERICQTCDTALDAVPDRYSGMAKRAQPPNELIAETFPNYYSVCRELIERERKVRDTPSLLTPAERSQRLREPFAILAPLVQQKLASVQVDARVWLAVAAFIPMGWIFAAIGQLFTPPDMDPDPRWAIAGILFGLGILGWQLLQSARRYVLKKTLPLLARALTPLRPTEGEIVEVIEELKRHKLKLGSKLRPDDVLAGIEQLRQAV